MIRPKPELQPIVCALLCFPRLTAEASKTAATYQATTARGTFAATFNRTGANDRTLTNNGARPNRAGTNNGARSNLTFIDTAARTINYTAGLRRYSSASSRAAEQRGNFLKSFHLFFGDVNF